MNIFGESKKPDETNQPVPIQSTPTQTQTPPKPNKGVLSGWISSLFGESKATANQLNKTGGTRKRKHKTRKNKTKGRINFSKIKWGSFTRIYHNYLHKHPSMKKQVPTLEQFAHYVNKHPNKFTKKTHKKAIFYTNIIEKK